MAPDLHDRVLAHDPQVDSAHIIAVDDHKMLIGETEMGFEDLFVETAQGRPVFNLNRDQNIGPDGIDNPAGVIGGFPANVFGKELKPSHPAVAAFGNHFQGAVFGFPEQRSSDLLQLNQRILRRVERVPFVFTRQFNECLFVAVSVNLFIDDGVGQRMIFDSGGSGGIGVLVHRNRPGEKIFQVE